ncbi:MAG: beta-lactamase family protein [Micropruina sp.]|nr:beta-lactamase family protein [Micropruina sp.]
MTMPRSTPSAQGVDARGLLGLLDALETPGHGTHSLMIARHGSVIAEGWWAPYASDRVHLGYSLSKSFTATTLGILAGRGVIDLDAPVLSYLVDLDAVDPVWRRVTVRHCISMTAGHSVEAWDWSGDSLPPTAAPADADPVLDAIVHTRVPDGEPGQVWAYNQVCTYLVAQAVAAVTGEPLTSHVRRLVLDPLGGDPARAQRTPQGRDLGFSGLHVTTATILALAQTWLDGGRYDGVELVPLPYALDAPTPTPASLRAEGMTGDWDCGYGMSFWGASHGYRGDGAFGQYAIVLPEHDVAVAITSEVEDMQATLDALWTHLLPAVDAAGSASADRQLAERLVELRHPPLRGAAGREGELRAVRHPQSQLPETYAAVRLRTTEGGHQVLVLEHADGELVTTIGNGEWLDSSWATRWGPQLRIAASGAWRDGVFRAQLRLVETPHTILVELHPDAHVVLNWRLVPLTGADPLDAVGFPI